MHVHFFFWVVRCRWTVEKLDVVIDFIRDVQYAQKSHNAYLNFLVKMKNKKKQSEFILYHVSQWYKWLHVCIVFRIQS